MSATYTGSPVKPTLQHTQPDDGDDANVASVNVTHESLADQLAYVQRLPLTQWSVARDMDPVGSHSENCGDAAVGKDASTPAADIWVAVFQTDGTATTVKFATSYDGMRWLMDSQISLTADEDINGVQYDAGIGLWAMVGDAGADAMILTSSDPNGTWTERANASASDLFGITSNGTIFCAVGDTVVATGLTYILTSSDGITWTSRTGIASRVMFDVVFANSLFVAVGGGVSSAHIITSPDGITWTDRSNPGTKRIRGVTWNGSVFCTMGSEGEVMTSPDGIAWTLQTGFTGQTNTSSENHQRIASDPVTGIIMCAAIKEIGMVYSLDDGVTFLNAGALAKETIGGLGEAFVTRFGLGRFVTLGLTTMSSSTLRRL